MQRIARRTIAEDSVSNKATPPRNSHPASTDKNADGFVSQKPAVRDWVRSATKTTITNLAGLSRNAKTVASFRHLAPCVRGFVS